MFNDTILEIITHEGPASIVTMGTDGPHIAATWNSYIHIEAQDEVWIPAGSLFSTEENVAQGSVVQLLIATKGVQGQHGDGTGYLLSGKAVFESSGPCYDAVKTRFSWARAVMIVKVNQIKQLI